MLRQLKKPTLTYFIHFSVDALVADRTKKSFFRRTNIQNLLCEMDFKTLWPKNRKICDSLKNSCLSALNTNSCLVLTAVYMSLECID